MWRHFYRVDTLRYIVYTFSRHTNFSYKNRDWSVTDDNKWYHCETNMPLCHCKLRFMSSTWPIFNQLEQAVRYNKYYRRLNWTGPVHAKWMIPFYSGRHLYQYNEDDFRFQFWLHQAIKQYGYTYTHRSQEKLSIKKASFLL